MASYCAGVVSSKDSAVHHGGGVDQHVEAAQLGDDAPRQLGGGRGVGQVGREAGGAAAGGDDLVAQRGGAGTRGVVMDGDRHAAVGQRPSQGLTQPPAGPGDEGDAPAKLHQVRGAMGRISPVGAPGPPAASAITPCVRSSSST